MDGVLKAFGHGLYRRQDLVRAVQWGLVAIYPVLLVGPVLLPGAPRLAQLAEALFWGVWWPAVILSMLVFGQFWCGLLCPDGALTEWASRHGRNNKPKPWMRHGWLPLVLFAVLTFLSDAFDAHRSAWGTLAAVGSMSLAGLAVGALYGRGKRVWCRYLCPTGSIFSLLARCSLLHFKVDRGRWESAPKPVPKPVECPVLLDVRRLVSNEKCNMCGRCSGHRDAVELAARPPGIEIATLPEGEARLWEAVGICFVLIGLGYGGALGHGDWQTILAIALGSGTAAVLALTMASLGRRSLATRLAYGLIPLAGLGLFLGGLEHSLSILTAQGVSTTGLLPWLRATTLVTGTGWSLCLVWQLTHPLPRIRRIVARAVMTVAAAGLALFYDSAQALL